MDVAETNARERESLFGLWESARVERDAAGHLLAADSRGFGRSAALHLLRGWHALATIRAHQSGSPEPELESFVVDEESEMLAPIGKRKRSSWDKSFGAIREAALAPPGGADRIEVDPKLLWLQLGFLGRCIAAQRAEVTMSSANSWKRLFGKRQVLTMAAAVVLVFVIINLGGRLGDDMEEVFFPESDEVQIPDTVKVELDRLGDFRPRGYAWDGSENTLFGVRLLVPLGERRHPDIISVSLDGNDRYGLRLMEGGEEVALLEVGPSPAGGLEVYTVAVPVDAKERGFDLVMIEVLDGDGLHSLGHLLLNEAEEIW